MKSKTDLRIKYKAIRKTLDIRAISRNIAENIRDFEPYQKAKNVMLFYPSICEVDLLELLNDNKKFYFPRVDGEDLRVCPYAKDILFEQSSFNINEPCSTPVSSELLDLILVPALAVDENNYRLGYGGGFYDRFLKTVPDTVKIVPIYHEFVIEKLPIEEFDVAVDFVITDVKKARL